jgi:hypothetical protein
MRFPIAILLTILAAYALGFWLAVPANPEVKFWQEVVERRDREIAGVRKENPDTPIIFFTGGSSCAFSIDPKIIEETCGLPAFNLGLPVAAGGKYLLHQALEKTKQGDVLVVCLEPDVLSHYKENYSPSKFSFALAAAAGRPSESSGGATFAQTPSIRDYLNFTRPGAGHLSTLGAKVASGRNYRYTESDLRYRGRVETPIKTPELPASEATLETHLTQDARKFLKTFVKAASGRKVKVLYSLPWVFTDEESVAKSRSNKQILTTDIQTILPTLNDGFYGVASESAYFSDSALHLTAEGSALRSQALAIALKSRLTHQ